MSLAQDDEDDRVTGTEDQSDQDDQDNAEDEDEDDGADTDGDGKVNRCESSSTLGNSTPSLRKRSIVALVLVVIIIQLVSFSSQW